MGRAVGVVVGGPGDLRASRAGELVWAPFQDSTRGLRSRRHAVDAPPAARRTQKSPAA